MLLERKSILSGRLFRLLVIEPQLGLLITIALIARVGIENILLGL
jgi:hypothetical protein